MTVALALDRNIILLPTGQSQYDVQLRFLTDLSDALGALGYEAPLLDPHRPEHFQQIIAWVQAGRVAGSFHWNGMWLRPVEMFDGQDLFDRHNVPSACWYGDPPLTYLPSRLILHAPQDLVLMADAQWVPLYQRYFPKAVSGCHFLQVAGRRLVETTIPLDQREHGLVFFASYLPSAHYWQVLETVLSQTLLPRGPVIDVVQAQLEAFLNQPEIHEHQDFSLSLLEGLDAAGISVIDPRNSHQVRILLQTLDRYLRAVRRESVVRAIRHLPLTIFGKGWEQFETDQTNLTFHPEVSQDENIRIVANSRMALSQNILTVGSAHCRIPYILAQSTPLLTETCDWIADHLEPGRGCLTYSFAPGVDIEAAIAPVYQNTAELERISARGYELFEQHLSWDGFARQLIDLFAKVSAQPTVRTSQSPLAV